MRRSLPSRYLTPVDLADLLGVPVETVYQWRRKHTGPRGFRSAGTFASTPKTYGAGSSP